MGGIGSDIAIESADAVLVSDDFKRLPYLFDLTQKVMNAALLLRVKDESSIRIIKPPRLHS